MDDEEPTFAYRPPETPADCDAIISKAREQIKPGKYLDEIVARFERIKARLEKGPIA